MLCLLDQRVQKNIWTVLKKYEKSSINAALHLSDWDILRFEAFEWRVDKIIRVVRVDPKSKVAHWDL